MTTDQSRRDFLTRLAAGAAAMALPRFAWSGQDGAKRPSFILLLADDLGYGDLGCFGHPLIRTPNLDKLAAEGIRLTDCYAASAVCSPSRSGLLTGRTPNRLGVYDWIPNNSPMHLRKSEITLASILRSGGYATCHVGKWHCNGVFNSPDQPQPGDLGFDHWFSTQNNASPSHLNPKNFVRNGKAVGPMEGYSSTIIANEAIAWLTSRKEADQPFCLFVWFHSPHEPIATGDEFVRMYPMATCREQAEYFGNITQMDYEIGRVLKHLDEAQQRDRTFVMFTSDNGPETLNRYKGGSRSYGSPGPLRGMKLHMYEGGIRVPGIIRFPVRAKAGEVCGEPVSSTDILPTFCDLAGAKAPADRAIDGASFVPVFEGKPIERKTPLYWQYDKAISKPKVAMRRGDWKILAGIGGGDRPGGFELYNVREDIGEKNDLAGKEGDRVKVMSATLVRLFDQIKAEGPKWATPQRAPVGGERD